MAGGGIVNLSRSLAVALAVASAGALAQTNFTTITTTGPASNRLNLVILAEGYLASQFGQFQIDATNLANLLLTNQPYAEYRSYFNVYSIAVPSLQAGSDHPNASALVNTYFNSTYGPSDYYLSIPEGSTGQGKVDALVSNYVGRADLAILLVNDSIPGGSDAGGRTAVVARGAVFGNLYTILPHETGHVFANLGDEYTTENPDYPETEEPNTTRETNRAALKWAAWIDATTPVPTPPTSTYESVIGLFEGAHYHATGWYRPALNCMMKSFGVGFCNVCSEAMVLSMYRRIRPLDGYNPAATNLTAATNAALTFRVQPLAPSGHSLIVEWRTNGMLVAGASGSQLELWPSQLGSGVHQITARVVDPTALVRSDPSNLLSQAVGWQLTVNLPQLQLTSARLAGNRMAFTVTGNAPQGVTIEASTNLLNWTSIATSSLSGGALQFTNTTPGQPWQFFRARTPP